MAYFFFLSTFSDEMDQQFLMDGSHSNEKKVRKIPTIRGDDIMRNPKLTKVGLEMSF